MTRIDRTLGWTELESTPPRGGFLGGFESFGFILPIQSVAMLSIFSAFCAAWLLFVSPPAGAKPPTQIQTELLPRSAALEPQIRFWTRIYSEVDQGGGLIHDSVQMGVVYEVIDYPEGLSSRSRERHVERAKDRYIGILKRLAKGKRTGLSVEEQREIGRAHV